MRRVTAVVTIGLLSLLLIAGSSASVMAGTPSAPDARTYLNQHGYLPIHGADTLDRAKSWAEKAVANSKGHGATTLTGASQPTLGPSWNGLFENDLAPPDTNGAIGPNSYLEIINLQLGIYSRTGAKVSSIKLQALTGHPSLSDPMILWDPDTQRFYYNVWDTSVNTMEWGFSKSSNPHVLPSDFCNFTSAFGYLPGQF